MSDLRIAVHVGRDERAVDAGTTAGGLFDGDKVVVAARVNGVLRDLAHVVEEGGREYWEYEGTRGATMGLNAVVGKSRDEYNPDPIRFAKTRI